MTRTPTAIETSEVRKRLRHAIEEQRKRSAARRVMVDAAASAYTDLLETTATPLVQKLANVLRAEGHNFTVFTPNAIKSCVRSRSGENIRMASMRCPSSVAW